MDSENTCGICTSGGCSGSYSFCRDLANVRGVCESSVCRINQYLLTSLTISLGFFSVGLFIDLTDIAWFRWYPNNVVGKSFCCLGSALVKLIGWGLVLNADSVLFVQSVVTNSCFHAPNNTLIILLYCLIVFGAISGFASVLGSAVSAFYGGRLTGLPSVPKK